MTRSYLVAPLVVLIGFLLHGASPMGRRSGDRGVGELASVSLTIALGFHILLLAPVANIQFLARDDAHLALVQNDIAYHAYNGREMFAEPGSNRPRPITAFRGVAMLYPETIQIVTLRDKGISRVEHLRGRRVVGGAGQRHRGERPADSPGARHLLSRAAGGLPVLCGWHGPAAGWDRGRGLPDGRHPHRRRDGCRRVAGHRDPAHRRRGPAGPLAVLHAPGHSPRDVPRDHRPDADRSSGGVRVAGEGRSALVAVAPGARVELLYTHTVERTPVAEVFQAERDGLWLVEVRFVSQGAGLPGDGYAREGGQYVLRSPRRVGALPPRIPARAGHRLRVGDRVLDLTQAFGDGASVVISSGPGRWRVWWPALPRW